MPDVGQPSAPRRPRFGKDHLNLADWPLGLATFQQPRKADGGKVDYVEYVVPRSDGTVQSVTLEAPSQTGLPTPSDEDVVIALLALAKEQQFASDIVRFVPQRLMGIMGWTPNDKSYHRLTAALKRLRAVTITYRLAWYSRKSAAVEPILITGILAEAKLVLRRGRRIAGAVPESYVQWTQNFFTSLQEGNLTDLDLDLYFSWNRPVAKHLHRHLNKVWHAGRRPRPYERNLRDLATGHLGMTANKDLKRNFHAVVRELEERRYLVPLDPAARYRFVRPGVWRVRMELHPDQVRGQRSRRGESQAGGSSDPAVALVAAWRCVRFGDATLKAQGHELRHARRLLKEFPADMLHAALPAALEAVRRQFRGEDCHFGAAVPFIEQAARNVATRTRQRAHEASVAAALGQEQTRLADHRADQLTERQRRLAHWRQLSVAERDSFYDEAIERATSPALRVRLRRHRHDRTPPAEVLAMLRTRHGESEGECVSSISPRHHGGHVDAH